MNCYVTEIDLSLLLRLAEQSFSFRLLEREEGDDTFLGELTLCFYSLKSLGMRVSFSSLGTPAKYSYLSPTLKQFPASGIPAIIF